MVHMDSMTTPSPWKSLVQIKRKLFYASPYLVQLAKLKQCNFESYSDNKLNECCGHSKHVTSP